MLKPRIALLMVLLFALTTAALYCCLLPLWEGFDEPFHYGYLQSLSITHRPPVFGETRISSEVRESLKLTPISPILHRSLPDSISFPEWFRLPPQVRAVKKTTLSTLPSELQAQASELVNYEAQQAPLAYVALLPFHALVDQLPIPRRILRLRFVVVSLSTLLFFAAAISLSNTLGLEDPLRLVALTCIFESQMLWASIAHVDNDWLAVPLAVAFLASLARVARQPRATNIFILGLLLAFGLLTKAYFLAFVPVCIALLAFHKFRSRLPLRAFLPGLAAVLLIAGPWYARNLFLYGNVSGMQEAARGVGLQRTLQALGEIDWPGSVMSLAHWSLWTGNWSFVSFSRVTLDTELILLLAGFLLLLVQLREITQREVWVLAAVGSFVLALFYDAGVVWADTKAVGNTASPWYSQAILPALWLLVFLGLQRNGLLGWILAALLSVLTAWIAALTYVAKLLPLYGGYEDRANLVRLWQWWMSNPTPQLASTTLARPVVVYCLLIAFLVQLVLLNAHLLRRIAQPYR